MFIVIEKEKLMKVREDPNERGRYIKRSICGDVEEFVKFNQMKLQAENEAVVKNTVGETSVRSKLSKRMSKP